jgi:hypothetical protein
MVRAQTTTISADAPKVSVSVAQTDDPYVILSASPGSYVVVVRVSDDLKAHVLYPASPNAQQPFPAGPGYFPLPLNIPKYSMGGVYAAASTIPFNFDAIANGNRWDSDALILKSSRDPEHAANRVLGMITPVTATVTSAETVYMGSRTAKARGPRIFVSEYAPSSVLVTNYVQSQFMTYGCAATELTVFSCRASGSMWVGCLRVGGRDVCGTAADIWDAMTASLPPRERLIQFLPVGSQNFTCGGEFCVGDRLNASSQWHPSADYSRPAPAPLPTPPSPTPLPSPVGTTPAIPPLN